MSGTVCILDDDDAVRDSLRTLLESYALEVRDFGSGQALLDSEALEGVGCFVVDFHMPEMNGMELLEALRSRGISAPAVIVSAVAVGAESDAKTGPVSVLTKPVPEEELIGWIRHALGGDAAST
jgi:FixJ family two-component response regulator